MSEKDCADLAFALDRGLEAVALSFVRLAADVLEGCELMTEIGRVLPIIAKIEKPEAVANLSEILQVSDGIMVARGELGVDLGPEEVSLVQKQSIEAAGICYFCQFMLDT